LILIFSIGTFINYHPKRIPKKDDPIKPLDDSRLWKDVIYRVRAGEYYYDAMETSLRTVPTYTTRPVWNFRLPTLALFIAFTKYDLVSVIFLSVLSFFVSVLWIIYLRRSSGIIVALLGLIFLTWPTWMAIETDMFVFHTIWAGILISLSIILYNRHYLLSIIAGLMALFIREISLPFVFIMLLAAWHEKKRREVCIWIFGIGIFFVYLAVHIYLASRHIRPEDPAKSWMAFQGWNGALRMAHCNLVSHLFGGRLTAFILPLALLGAWSFPGSIGKRIAWTLTIFTLTFFFAGNPDNWYWGLLYASPLALGLAYSYPAIYDLLGK
jgi:hypothetical protein